MSSNVFLETSRTLAAYAEQHDGILVSFSGGKDSVHEDSIIWVRVDGVLMRTTPAKLLDHIYCPLERQPSGQWVGRPRNDLRILTTSTNYQSTAEPVFAKVSRVMLHDVDDPLFRLDLRGGHSLCVTGDHSLMAVRSAKKEPHGKTSAAYPCQAKDVQVGTPMFSVSEIPGDGQEADYPDWFFRLAGLWVADGCHVYNRGRRLGKIIISTGHGEDVLRFLHQIPRERSKSELIEEYLDEHEDPMTAERARSIGSQFGVSASCVYNVHYGRVAVRQHQFIRCRVKDNGDAWLCDRHLADMLFDAGFHGKSTAKHIPDWLFGASRRQIALFLAGYIDGDGCITDRSVVFSTISHDLAFGLRDLFARLGIYAAIRESRGRIGGFRTTSEAIFHGGLSGVDSLDRFKREVPTFKDCSKITHCVEPKIHGNIRTRQVKSITTMPPARCRVFDFEVDDKHTFVADGILVHNSLVVLDLCLKAFKRVACYYFFFVPELECEMKQLEYAKERYGVEVFQYPSFASMACLREGLFCNEHYSLAKLPEVGPFQMADLIQNERGYTLSATGMKDADGYARKVCLTRTDKRDNVVHPIRKWNKYEVLAYLRTNNIPIPASYSKVTGGMVLRPDSMIWAKDTYPDDYAKMCRWFPYIPAMDYRNRWYGIPGI